MDIAPSLVYGKKELISLYKKLILDYCSAAGLDRHIRPQNHLIQNSTSLAASTFDLLLVAREPTHTLNNNTQNTTTERETKEPMTTTSLANLTCWVVDGPSFLYFFMIIDPSLSNINWDLKLKSTSIIQDFDSFWFCYSTPEQLKSLFPLLSLWNIPNFEDGHLLRWTGEVRKSFL